MYGLYWAMIVFPFSEPDSPDSIDHVEMPVVTQDVEAMLTGQCGNPGIILWNWGPRALQLQANFGVFACRIGVDCCYFRFRQELVQPIFVTNSMAR